MIANAFGFSIPLMKIVSLVCNHPTIVVLFLAERYLLHSLKCYAYIYQVLYTVARKKSKSCAYRTHACNIPLLLVTKTFAICRTPRKMAYLYNQVIKLLVQVPEWSNDISLI